jgi:hypothetical protein
MVWTQIGPRLACCASLGDYSAVAIRQLRHTRVSYGLAIENAPNYWMSYNNYFVGFAPELYSPLGVLGGSCARDWRGCGNLFPKPRRSRDRSAEPPILRLPLRICRPGRSTRKSALRICFCNVSIHGRSGCAHQAMHSMATMRRIVLSTKPGFRRSRKCAQILKIFVMINYCASQMTSCIYFMIGL